MELPLQLLWDPHQLLRTFPSTWEKKNAPGQEKQSSWAGDSSWLCSHSDLLTRLSTCLLFSPSEIYALQGGGVLCSGLCPHIRLDQQTNQTRLETDPLLLGRVLLQHSHTHSLLSCQQWLSLIDMSACSWTPVFMSLKQKSFHLTLSIKGAWGPVRWLRGERCPLLNLTTWVQSLGPHGGRREQTLKSHPLASTFVTSHKHTNKWINYCIEFKGHALLPPLPYA